MILKNKNMKKFILMLAMGCFCSNLVAVASGDNGSTSEKPKSREVKLQGVIKRPQGGRSIVLQPCMYAYMGDNTLIVDLSAFSSTDVRISVTDMTDGTLVYDEIHSGGDEVEIVLDNLSAGTVYQIDVETENIIFTGEFVFQ